jgi:MFS family permease
MKKSRILLWLVLLFISLTGVALYALAPASLDDFPHPLNGLFRALHGVAAAAAMLMLGYMFANHVQKKIAQHKRGWRKQVWDGYVHLSLWVLLIVTGLLLYYPQDALPAVAQLHWYLGLVLMVVFPVHYFWRKKASVTLRGLPKGVRPP